MKHIQIAMEKLIRESNADGSEKNVEHISILEKILKQTKDPKIAAVLALDLMLVGVDTVNSFHIDRLFLDSHHVLLSRLLSDICRNHIDNLSTQSKC